MPPRGAERAWVRVDARASAEHEFLEYMYCKSIAHVFGCIQLRLLKYTYRRVYRDVLLKCVTHARQEYMYLGCINYVL